MKKEERQCWKPKEEEIYRDGKRKDREWDVNEGRESRAIARGRGREGGRGGRRKRRVKEEVKWLGLKEGMDEHGVKRWKYKNRGYKTSKLNRMLHYGVDI